MVQKIARDSLTAKVSAARAMEDAAIRRGDKLAAMQFSRQRTQLEADLEALGQRTERLASVALYFGGAPVLGNYGIKADFAGKAIEAFQDVVSKRFARAEVGQLGQRGKVPHRASAELMVTEVARGSFGFILEEAAAAEPIVRTALVDAVDDAAQLVVKLSSPDEQEFESAMEDLDGRLLIAVRRFFATLYNEEASLRIVEGDFDRSLGAGDVQRAFARASSIEVDERDAVELRGRLHILPKSKRFEFSLLGSDEVIAGTVASDVAKLVGDQVQQGFDSPAGKFWRARFHVREVTRRNQTPRRYHTLEALLEELPPPEH